MSEKSQNQLLEELETLHRRLAQRERAMSKQTEAEASAQRQLADLQNLLDEYRKEIRQARKISAALARNGQRAEQLSKGHADAFELVCGHGSDLVFRLSREGKIVYLSPSSARLLGFAASELQGRRWWDVVEGRTQEQALRFVEGVIAGGQLATDRWSFKRKRGAPLTLEVHCRAVPHPQTGEGEIVGVARPVSASFALAGLGSSEAWIASLGHELKQPLTAIANYANACIRLVEAGTMETADLLHALEQTAQQAERAAELIHRLRNLGAPEALQCASVQINDLVKEALDLLDEDVRVGKVQVDLHLGKDVPSVQMDWIQMGQVLINLIRNALEALENQPPQERRISIASRCAGTDVEVAICDTGPGLSVEMVERLFEPFQTTKPEGMGLGLALSRAIVQAHGGRLWFKPNAGQGTTFLFTLPRNHEQ